MAFDGHRLTTAHTTTKQQQVVTAEKRTERRCDGWEARGTRDTITFGGGDQALMFHLQGQARCCEPHKSQKWIYKIKTLQIE